MPKVKLHSGTSWLAIFASQGIICAAAADPITVTQTINLNQNLANNSSYSGMFDINSLLPTSGGYSAPFDILSATLSVYGYSSPAAQQVVGAYSQYQQSYAGQYYYTYSYPIEGYYYTSYSCGWFATCYQQNYYYYTGYAQATAPIYNEVESNTVTNLDNTKDTLAVTAGSDTLTGSDTRTVTDNGTTQTYQGSNGGGGNPVYYYYSDTDNINDFISGPLSAAGALSAASLALLAQDGQLAYNVSAPIGQFELTQLNLTVTLEQSVPEPSTLSIFGFGLLLVALRARQYKRPSAEQ